MQRGANGQPTIGLVRSGGRPGIDWSRVFRSPIRGIEPKSATV
jgi:hypothetical protein